MKPVTMSERTFFGAMLTFAAGGIDAFSFLMAGEVFAGLQTGNLILLGISLGRGGWATSLRYLFAIASFMVGTAIVRIIQKHHLFEQKLVARRTLILVYEIVLLVLAMLLKNHVEDEVVVIVLALAASAELQEFRTLNGGPFTPLMMTGNIRTLTESLHDALRFGDKKAQTKFFQTAIIMLTFLMGAALVALLLPYLHAFSLVGSVLALLLGIGCLQYDRRHNLTV